MNQYGLQKPMLVGLAGFKQVGKSTAAQALVRKGYTELSFAAPMRQFIDLFFREVDPGFNLERDKEKPINWLDNTVTPRNMMQSLGTEWGRDTIHQQLWIRRALALAARARDAGSPVVISDLRFENEVKAVRAAGGIVIWINRAGHEPGTHRSEGGVPPHMIDYLFTNNANEDNLCRGIVNLVDYATQNKRLEEPLNFVGPDEE